MLIHNIQNENRSHARQALDLHWNFCLDAHIVKAGIPWW